MKKRVKPSIKWALRLLLWSFAISIALTLFSARALSGAGLISAALILLVFVALGVGFDMLGVAAATALEKPFHAMAANRVTGASESIRLIKNADRVASFCSDMVGDICGIVSGVSSAAIVTVLTRDLSASVTATMLVVSGLLAGLTVSAKALFKPVAMRHNTQIVLMIGRLIHIVKGK
ncbi:MAG: hypothetical protein FWH16_01510 [Oscillospiraceae bacterium]|nr:hypothetical protein [Oscillospiraceae bacterium]